MPVISFEQALKNAQENGTLRELRQVNEKVWTVGTKGATRQEDKRGFLLGTDAAAVELIEFVKGTAIAAPNSVSNVNGNKGTTGVVMEAKSLPYVIHARDLYTAITGLPCEWWSVPRIARALLEWAAKKEPTDPADEQFLLPGMWHHQSCPRPGKYSSLDLHDVSAFYYSLLLRLSSPRVRYLGNGPIFTSKLEGQERERWLRMLLGVEPHKTMRNSLVGCMAGGNGSFPTYTSKGGTTGVYRFPTQKQNGPYRAAGLLIVATGAELTYRQALTNNAIYANIDCIVCPSGTPLAPVWSSYGLRTGVKASGAADIRRVGCWRIGDQKTDTYIKDLNDYAPSTRIDPGTRYADRWLKNASVWH